MYVCMDTVCMYVCMYVCIMHVCMFDVYIMLCLCVDDGLMNVYNTKSVEFLCIPL